MSSSPPPPLRPRVWAALAAIMAIGLGVRLAGVGEAPPGLWFDEGLNGFNALQILSGEWSLYFNRHGYPQEPLHMYAVALAMWLGFEGPLAVRLPSAILGALTLPVAFGCFREAFRSNRGALLGAAGLTVMSWHVTFSHVGFRAIWVPLIAAACGWMTLRLLRRPSLVLAMALGLAMAFGCHTYLAARLLPLFVLGTLLWAMVRRRRNPALGSQLESATAIVIVAFLVGVAPLTIHLVRNPDLAVGRISEVTLFGGDEEKAEGESLAIGQGRRVLGGAGENLLANLWFFTTRGDHVARHGPPRVPVFDPVTAGLFLVGLWVSLRNRRAGTDLLLLWLGCLLLASVLSFGAPNRLRTLGAAPAAMGLVAVGVHRVVVLTRCHWGRRLALGVALVWLGWFAVIETARFWSWQGREDVWEQYNGTLVTIAEQIQSHPPTDVEMAADELLGNEAYAFLVRRHRDRMRSLVELAAFTQPTRHHVYVVRGMPGAAEGLARHLRNAQLFGEFHLEALRRPSGRPFADHLIVEPGDD